MNINAGSLAPDQCQMSTCLDGLPRLHKHFLDLPVGEVRRHIDIDL